MRALLTTLLFSLALASSSHAGVRLVVEPPEYQKQLQGWMDKAHMPSPSEEVRVYVWPDISDFCGPAADGCASSNEIYMSDRKGHYSRALLYHEMAHQFDFFMRENSRYLFMEIFERGAYDYYDWYDKKYQETFAEAWTACATYRKLPQDRYDDRDPYINGYGYLPSRKQHKRVCKMIKREAKFQRWSR